MTDATPYLTRPASEIAHEKRCMEELFRHAPQVNLIYEAFGGIGLAAEIWNRTHPRASVESSDLDWNCIRRYNERGLPRASCLKMDALTSLEMLISSRAVGPSRSWAASLDFNKFTILDLRNRPSGHWKEDLLARTLEQGPRWCQLTDSAVRYLHLNWERYGLPDRTVEEYVVALGREVRRLCGYRVTHSVSYYAATYLLLEPAT